VRTVCLIIDGVENTKGPDVLNKIVLTPLMLLLGATTFAKEAGDVAFFESKIRPLLVKKCFECHSEKAKSAEGGLLLDRRSGWMQGGDSGKAVVPGDPEASLLVKAVKRQGELKMPPDEKLTDAEIELLLRWIRRGAPGAKSDLGESEFSRLGDQDYLFGKAASHWAFKPVQTTDPPAASAALWDRTPIDRFVYHQLKEQGISPSAPASPRQLARRLTYGLTGLPPSPKAMQLFLAEAQQDRRAAVNNLVDKLLDSPAFGEHFGRLWLDVARYADTDSFYRPDTRTPHYFPFAFTYRDYVIRAYNTDKPFDRFLLEQLAADLLEPTVDAKTIPALGFLSVGPHANRNQLEVLDDWIDVTTRGLMGLTAACARCHDHKYEPIPTADYYSLRGVFASVTRIKPLDEKRQPLVPGYQPSAEDRG